MSTIIRSYKKIDITEIVAIINYNILYTTSIYDYSLRTEARQIAIFEEKLLKGFPIIVAESNGKCVGFGSYSEFRFREANLYTVEHSIYVDNNYSGQGIGKQLMKALIEQAKTQNLHTMIGVIDTQNRHSIMFHEKFNFKSVGIIKEVAYKFDNWLDCNIMQLILK